MFICPSNILQIKIIWSPWLKVLLFLQLRLATDPSIKGILFLLRKNFVSPHFGFNFEKKIESTLNDNNLDVSKLLESIELQRSLSLNSK